LPVHEPFRNGRRPLFPDACKTLIRHLNRALVAMLLALFLAAIQFSSARVLCVYGLPYLVIDAWQATALLQMRFPDLVHHDPPPLHLALWRVACLCAVVRQDGAGSGFLFQPQGEPQA
jgi:hypothetical protein